MDREIQEFRAGERDYVNGGEFTYLRFQNGRIETSKRVNLEFMDAKEHYSALKAAQRARLAGTIFIDESIRSHDFDGYKLGDFSETFFQIGCHKIQYTELDVLAKSAGFTMQAMKQEG